MNNQKGQILLVVFMLMIFVGLLAGGAAFMWQSAANTGGLEKDSLRAFYLAQAGIELARTAIDSRGQWDNNMKDYEENFSGNLGPASSYDVAITKQGNQKKIIVSTGSFNNSTRQIKMTIARDAGGGNSPPYGNAWGYYAHHQNTWVEQ
jgi:Tfp pilus assembly protein PilX